MDETPCSLLYSVRARIRIAIRLGYAHEARLRTNVYIGTPVRLSMELVTPHRLASLCQRMPLPVFLEIGLGEGTHLCRVVKNEFCDYLRTLDPGVVLSCRMTLNEVIVYTNPTTDGFGEE